MTTPPSSNRLEPADAASQLAVALRDDSLAVVVGAGTSADSQDQSGRVYRGLPLPSQFVQKLANQRPTSSYVNANDDFEVACGKVVQRHGRAALETLLVESYGRRRGEEAPPASKILAWLPFRIYITSNYDECLEDELDRGHRRPGVVVGNTDLPLLRRDQIPVVKYHGCVSRPSTMIATPDDYERLHESYRLAHDLVKVSLSQNPLLVIGHGLGDHDLERLLGEVLDDLGQDYTPTLYIVREPGRSDPLAIPQRHYLIDEDLTQFLSRLLHEYRSDPGAATASFVDERWINSAFFAQLRQATVLPSETQVIDAFLAHLAEELTAREEVATVVADARVAVDGALDERPNFSALRKLWIELEHEVESTGNDLAKAEEAVHNVIEQRTAKIAVFKRLGRAIVQRQDRILLYSQSQRVIQTLQGVSPAVQRTCDLFVAECRPKSPGPYEDTVAVCRQLQDTGYNIDVCPDVVAINLMATHQITQVIMGTHAIYVEDDIAYAFVNTCGSLAIAIAAEAFGVRCTVVGEHLKVEHVPRAEADDHLTPHQEHELTAAGLVGLATGRAQVGHLNIGYDLVPVTANIHVEVPDAVASP